MRRLFQFVIAAVVCNQTSCNGQTTGSANSLIETVSEKNNTTIYYGIAKIESSKDTSAGWKLRGQKVLLTGIVYKNDGRTPAPGVFLYYYQTNPEGKYLHKPEEVRSMEPNELGQTHGYIRGWVKTDHNGRYSIYTIRPGAYPGNDEPAHIHITVKEPNDIKEYYLDDFVFDDDKILNSARRKKLENRGGSGILRMVKQDDLLIGERNIILGLNIPGYPVKPLNTAGSGGNIGEDVFSFIPYHAWGPDKGTRTCPVCKYGWYHGILYFVGNKPNWDDIRTWVTFLENESRKREKYLKVYFVYGNEKGYDKAKRTNELENLGRELKLEKLALTFVPSFTDSESEIDLNKINPEVENTFIIYKRSRIVGKFINLKPSPHNFKMVSTNLDETINEYFNLPQNRE